MQSSGTIAHSPEGLLRNPSRPPARRWLLSVFLTIGWIATLPVEADAQAEPAPLRLEACRLVDDTLAGRCGTVSVWEDREAASGRRIDLSVVVIPAQSPTPRPDPVFLLAGGPGQAASDLVEMVERLPAVHRDRDMVFVDQRGTGGSNPLACSRKPVDRWVGYGPDEDAFWAECIAELSERANLRYYTTPAAVDDFDQVRAALGYERVNLIGGSYGTRVAQVYLERHPERVRSAVLWGVAPVGYDIPVGGGLAVQDGMERLVEDCRSDAACAAAFPRMGAQVDSLLTSLAGSPVEVVLPSAPGRDEARVVMTRELFGQALLALLFDAGAMRRMPALVDRAAQGNWTTFASIGAQILGISTTDPDGMYLSVVCNEDVPFMVEERLDGFRGAFGALLRESAKDLVHRCGRWPTADHPVEIRVPDRATAPVLVLSGSADPATPPGGGEQASRYLSVARHVQVPATSHGPIFPGCVGGLVAEFIETTDPFALDVGCLDELQWEPFAIPAGGGGR